MSVMSDFLKPIDEQVVVITGASSGIGLATAFLAADRGAQVVLAARSADTLEEVSAEMRQAGKQVAVVVADVSKRADVEKIADAAIAAFGRIDTWVNDAGVAIYGRLDEVADEESRRLFDVNFWGVVYGSLVALPWLKRQGGALINVGSEVSDAVIPLQGMYAASKHAVKGFTDALRVEQVEVAKAPISITLIQPTAVNTPYPEHARNYMDQQPKLPDPMIDPQEVAEAILRAAEKGGRDVRVGATAVLNSAMSKILPSLADKFAAKQASRQQESLPPRNPAGTLYEPGHSGRIHGVGQR